jgi:hypothetical protein
MIRPALALLITLLASGLAPAEATEMMILSKVDTVTVFPSGAEVARVFDVKVPEGSHVLVLADLPSAVVENSIRVTA